jgi:glycosyltransferase involved in cell wall biosynthesis
MIMGRLLLAARIIKTHAQSGVFDSDWYSQAYTCGYLHPLLHFALIGVHEGNSPNQRFNTEAYYSLNHDSGTSSTGPLLDYLFKGWWKNSPLSPSDLLSSVFSMVIIPKQKKCLPNSAFLTEKMRITWVIPDFVAGHGGHMTIFRMASYLEKRGHQVDLLITNSTHHQSAEEALQSINRYFLNFSGRIYLTKGALPEVKGDALIATDRQTCYTVDAMSGFHRKFYFVQDHESEFYPTGTEALLAENTYRMGFDCLSCGEWLNEMMSKKYGLTSRVWHLSHDREFYYLDKNEKRAVNRIAFYARYTTPRRAVELGFKALDILAQRGFKFEVDFFGADLGAPRLPYEYISHGILNANALGRLYRRATLGVVFSATNHSIINKEMMACGLPVVDLDVESVRAVFPEGVIMKAMPHPIAIVDVLEKLLMETDIRTSLSHKGVEYANQFSWDDSGKIIEEAIRERVTMTLAGSIPSNA